MNKQLLQRALDALEKNLQSLVFGVTFDMTQAAIEELRAAIDAVAPYHLPEAGNMVAQPAQADLQAAFAKGMACRPASTQPAQIPDAQQPFGWYDPSEDKFSRDRDAHKRGATLWLMFSDAVAPDHMPAAGKMVQ